MINSYLVNIPQQDLNNPQFISALQGFLSSHPNCSAPAPGIPGLIGLLSAGFGEASTPITSQNLYALMQATVEPSPGPHIVPPANNTFGSVVSPISSNCCVVPKNSSSSTEEKIKRLLNPGEDDNNDPILLEKLNKIKKDADYKNTCKRYFQTYKLFSELENCNAEQLKKLNEVIDQIRNFFIKTETFTLEELNASAFVLQPYSSWSPTPSASPAPTLTVTTPPIPPTPINPPSQTVIEDLIGKVKEEWAGFGLLCPHFIQFHDYTITTKLEEARQASDAQAAITELNILRAAIYFQRFCKKHQNLRSAQNPTLKPEERELYEKANQFIQTTFINYPEKYVYFNSHPLKDTTIEILSIAYYTLYSLDPKNMQEMLQGLNSIKYSSFVHNEELLEARNQLLKGIAGYTSSQIENLIREIGGYVVTTWPETQEEIEKKTPGGIPGQLIRCVDIFLRVVKQTPAITDYTDYAKFLKMLFLTHTPQPAAIIDIVKQLKDLVSQRIQDVEAMIPSNVPKASYKLGLELTKNKLSKWPDAKLGKNIDAIAEEIRQLRYAEDHYHITPLSELECTQLIGELRAEYQKHYGEEWKYFTIFP